MNRSNAALMSGIRPGNLQFHVHHQLKRYDSEDDLRKYEKSYFLMSPVSDRSDSGFVYDDDAKEFTGDEDMKLSLENPPVLEEDLLKDCNRPISIVSMKRGNEATHVPDEDHHEEDDSDVDEIDEMTPPTPDTHSSVLPKICLALPEAVPKKDTDMISYYQSLYRNSISDDGFEMDGEILEATQIMYIAPPSRPCVVSIHRSSTDRMGRPGRSSRQSSRQASRGRFERERSRKLSSVSTASPVAYSPERPKPYTDVGFLNPFGEKKATHSQTNSRTASPAGQAHRSFSTSRKVGQTKPQQTEAGRPRANTSASIWAGIQPRQSMAELMEMMNEASVSQQEPSQSRAWSGRRPHQKRSWSDNSISSVSSMSSRSSKWSVPPATNHSSATSLPLSPSDSEKLRMMGHSRFNSSETDPRSECSLPGLSTTSSYSRGQSSVDSGSPRSEDAHLNGLYRLSVVMTGASLEDDPAEATTDKEVASINYDFMKSKYKKKTFMGIPLGRRRRIELI